MFDGIEEAGIDGFAVAVADVFNHYVSAFCNSQCCLNVPFGADLASVLRSSAGWESGDVFGLADPLRDLSVVRMGRWVSFCVGGSSYASAIGSYDDLVLQHQWLDLLSETAPLSASLAV